MVIVMKRFRLKELSETGTLVMNKDNFEFTVTFHCDCGNSFQNTSPIQKDFKVRGCPKCAVTNPVKGKKIKYTAPSHRPNADTVFSNSLLNLGEVYTILKVKQWQHGTIIWLAEIGLSHSFNLSAFGPVTDKE